MDIPKILRGNLFGTLNETSMEAQVVELIVVSRIIPDSRGEREFYFYTKDGDLVAVSDPRHQRDYGK